MIKPPPGYEIDDGAPPPAGFTVDEQDNSRARGFAFGAYKPLENASKALLSIPGMKQADAWMAENLGTTPYDQIVAEREAGRANNTRTGYQIAGNVAGTLPLAPFKGGLAVQGGLSGALLSDADNPVDLAKDTVIGAGASVVGGKLLNVIGDGVRPYVAKGVQKLADAGVPLTVGQIAGAAADSAKGAGKWVGNAVRGVEDRLEGLPVIGTAIGNAKQRGVEAYNRSVLDRALAKIGEAVPEDVPAGHEMIKHVGDRLSAAYEAIVPNLTATVDKKFIAELDAIAVAAKGLPDATRKQFLNIIRGTVQNRQNGAKLEGEAFKQAESALSAKAAAYTASPDPDQRIMGQAINEVRDSLRGLLARGNPAQAERLQAINTGWRELSVAEKAAARQGNAGVFTPKQYAGEARAADKTVRHRATARGASPNQDVTEAAARTISNPIPDSGTAGRGLLAALTVGGVGATGGWPAVAGMGAAALPYTKAGQSAIEALLLSKRPEVVRKAAAGASYLAPYLLPSLAVGD